MKVPVTVTETGVCEVYLPRKTARSIKCLRLGRKGAYSTYYYNLPELSKHCDLVVTDESKQNLIALREQHKEALNAKIVEAEDISELFTEDKQPKPFQLQAINFGLHQKSILMADDVGCVVGDAIVTVNRARCAKKMKLKDLCFKFNGGVSGNNKRWDLSIPTKMSSMDHSGILRLNDVVAVINKGEMATVRIIVGNYSVSLTADHEVFTEGGWTKAGMLRSGQKIAVNGLVYCPECRDHTERITYKYAKFKGKCKRCMYRRFRKNTEKNGKFIDKDGYVIVTKGIRNHPRQRSGHIYQHILVAEANLNNMSYEEWLDCIERNDLKDKEFVTYPWQTHHKNGDTADNRLENIEIISLSQHHVEHGRIRNIDHMKIAWKAIDRIEDAGMDNVFDVVMDNPNRNFVANGVVVHNCGKTIEAIGIILKSFEQEQIDGVIIIAPPSVKYQWRREIDDCNKYLPDVLGQITVIDGNKKQRTDQYKLKNTFTILHYQCVLNDAPLIAELMEDREMIVVADECSDNGAIKNATSKTAKSFKKLFKDAKYKLALTATPIENRLYDLYSIMEWVDAGPFGMIKHFEEKFCDIIQLPIRLKCRRCGRAYPPSCPVCHGNPRRFNVPKVIGYSGLNEAKARIADRYIRRTAKQVGEQLPEVTSVVYRVPMTDEAMAMYASIRGGLKSQEKLIGKIIPLRRCCAAPCLVGGKGEDSGKIAELLRLLETELSGETCIIVTQWVEKWMDILERKLKKYRPLIMHGKTDHLDREKIKGMFMDGVSDVLLMSEIGGRGLNLQRANVLINLDFPWNPQKLWQRIGRIYRMGSEHKNIRIVSFVMADTIEERVLDVLSDKQDLFRALFATDGAEKLNNVVQCWGDSAIRKLM